MCSSSVQSAPPQRKMHTQPTRRQRRGGGTAADTGTRRWRPACTDAQMNAPHRCPRRSPTSAAAHDRCRAVAVHEPASAWRDPGRHRHSSPTGAGGTGVGCAKRGWPRARWSPSGCRCAPCRGRGRSPGARSRSASPHLQQRSNPPTVSACARSHGGGWATGRRGSMTEGGSLRTGQMARARRGPRTLNLRVSRPQLGPASGGVDRSRRPVASLSSIKRAVRHMSCSSHTRVHVRSTAPFTAAWHEALLPSLQAAQRPGVARDAALPRALQVQLRRPLHAPQLHLRSRSARHTHESAARQCAAAPRTRAPGTGGSSTCPSRTGAAASRPTRCRSARPPAPSAAPPASCALALRLTRRRDMRTVRALLCGCAPVAEAVHERPAEDEPRDGVDPRDALRHVHVRPYLSARAALTRVRARSRSCAASRAPRRPPTRARSATAPAGRRRALPRSAARAARADGGLENARRTPQ